MTDRETERSLETPENDLVDEYTVMTNRSSCPTRPMTPTPPSSTYAYADPPSGGWATCPPRPTRPTPPTSTGPYATTRTRTTTIGEPLLAARCYPAVG